MEYPLSALLDSFVTHPSPHRVARIDRDRSRWREIAGPFFDAGGKSFNLSEMDAEAQRAHRQQRRGAHIFFIVLHGELDFRVGGTLIHINSGDMLFIPAGQPFGMHRKTHAAWIELELANNDLWRPLEQRGHYVREYESTAFVYLLVSSIIRALRTQDLYSIRCACENAEILISLLKRELDRSALQSNTIRSKKISDLVTQMQAHPEYQWALPNMCQRAAMSQRSLCRTFKAEFGMPPVQMLRRIRMSAAANFLTSTDRTVTDISNAVGYESQYSFSRLFKKSFGISPNEFRHLPQRARQELLAQPHHPEVKKPGRPSFI